MFFLSRAFCFPSAVALLTACTPLLHFSETNSSSDTEFPWRCPVNPARTLITWPTSDVRLDNLNNLSSDAITGSYLPQQWSDILLTSSIAVDRHYAGFESLYDLVRDIYLSLNPKGMYGSYTSGAATRMESHMIRYPNEAIPYESMPENFYKGPYIPPGPGGQTWGGYDRAYVDINQDDAFEMYVHLITEEMNCRDVSFAYLDNIVHPMSDSTETISWARRTAFLKKVRLRLLEAKIRTTINIAVTPWFMSPTDSALLMDAVDGLTLEEAFHKVSTRPFYSRVAQEIATLRTWLDAGMHIQIMVGWDTGGVDSTDKTLRYNAQENFLAALAMIIRQPRHALFMDRIFYRPEPEWTQWPSKLGAPIGDYVRVGISDPPVLSRSFEHGTVTVDFGKSIDSSTSAQQSAVNVLLF